MREFMEMLEMEEKELMKNLEGKKNELAKIQKEYIKILSDDYEFDGDDIKEDIEDVLFNKYLIESDIDVIESTLNMMNKIKEIRNNVKSSLEMKRDYLKKAEDHLRKVFYSGEYDSALVENLQNVSTKLSMIDELINEKETDEVEEDVQEIRLPNSGLVVKLHKLNDDDLEAMYNNMRKQSDFDGEILNILNKVNKECNRTELKNESEFQPKAYRHSTKHLFDEKMGNFMLMDAIRKDRILKSIMAEEERRAEAEKPSADDLKEQIMSDIMEKLPEMLLNEIKKSLKNL